MRSISRILAKAKEGEEGGSELEKKSTRRFSPRSSSSSPDELCQLQSQNEADEVGDPIRVADRDGLEEQEQASLNDERGRPRKVDDQLELNSSCFLPSFSSSTHSALGLTALH